MTPNTTRLCSAGKRTFSAAISVSRFKTQIFSQAFYYVDLWLFSSCKVSLGYVRRCLKLNLLLVPLVQPYISFFRFVFITIIALTVSQSLPAKLKKCPQLWLEVCSVGCIAVHLHTQWGQKNYICQESICKCTMYSDIFFLPSSVQESLWKNLPHFIYRCPLWHCIL